MTFERFETVIVPFPFTDRMTTKRRPALVLSHAGFTESTENLILAMITSAKQSDWFGDTVIKNLDEAGLPQPSKVRMKIFTLEQRLIERRIGELSLTDRRAVAAALKAVVGL